jgi:hypothetical protein
MNSINQNARKSESFARSVRIANREPKAKLTVECLHISTLTAQIIASQTD